MAPLRPQSEHAELHIEFLEDMSRGEEFQTRSTLVIGLTRETMEARHPLVVSVRETEATLPSLARTLRGSRFVQRADASTDVQLVGCVLFDALFGGALEPIYRNLVGRAEKGGASACLRLLFPAVDPERGAGKQVLASLPWESMYDSRRRDFVALMRGMPMVRGTTLERAPDLAVTSEPPKILIVTTDLKDEALGARAEAKMLTALIGSSTSADRVEWLVSPSPTDLAAKLRTTDAAIVHFIGSVTSGDPFALPLPAVTGAPLDLERFANLPVQALVEPGAISPSIQFVFLSACRSAQIAAALLSAVPVVVGVQGDISIEHATEFARAFYSAMYGGNSVPTAFSDARRTVDRAFPGQCDWALPVLITNTRRARLVAAPTSVDRVGFSALTDDGSIPPEVGALLIRKSIADVNLVALRAMLAKGAANAGVAAQIKAESDGLHEIVAKLHRLGFVPEEGGS